MKLLIIHTSIFSGVPTYKIVQLSQHNISANPCLYRFPFSYNSLNFKLLHENRKWYMNETVIQEEVDTLIFTGHDTVSAAIIHSFVAFANRLESKLSRCMLQQR